MTEVDLDKEKIKEKIFSQRKESKDPKYDEIKITLKQFDDADVQPDERIRRWEEIRVIEEKRLEEVHRMLIGHGYKLNTIIKMLTAIGYEIEKIKK